MNMFALMIWVLAILPLFGHGFCLATLHKIAPVPRAAARSGLLLGLLIVAINLVQLFIWNLPPDRRGGTEYLIVVTVIVAAIVSIFAIRLMRRSADFDVQSIGIPSVIVSLFSMASVLALGSLTISG